MTRKIFRAPIDAMDEIMPDLTLAQWARGGGPDECCSTCLRSPYRSYEPGEIVAFVSTEELATLDYQVGEAGFDGPPPPAGYTWVREAEDHENSASTLEELFKCMAEMGATGAGEAITLIFQRDVTEYWRCTGSWGRQSTYDFAPASLTEKLAALLEELEDFTGPLRNRGHLLADIPAPVSAAELKELLRHVLTAIGDQKLMTPVLIEEGSA